MILIGLVILKFFVYFGVFVAAVPMLGLSVADRTSFALKWSSFRLLLGFLLGLLIAWLFGVATDAKVPSFLAYSLSFILVRYAAWLLVLVLVAKMHGLSITAKSHRWVLLGVAANVVIDGLALAGGADQVRLWC